MNSNFLLFLCILFLAYNCRAQDNVLVFSKTNGYRHNSIEAGIQAMKQLAEKNNWLIHCTQDSSHFTSKELKAYQTIIFLNTTGDVLGNEGQAALKEYIQAGGGFVGIHAASDTEHDWPWYGEMLGARFANHPPIQEGVLNINHKTKHRCIEHLGNHWIRKDEWYNFKEAPKEYVEVLIDLDENSLEGITMNAYHPISWLHEFQGGKIFYTAMGHTVNSFSEKDFLIHLEEGIIWTLKKDID